MTVCDTTSYIANHTKRSAWKVFEENHSLLNNLDTGELAAETIKFSGNYACRLYRPNVRNTDSVDIACHLLFSKTMKPEAMAPTRAELTIVPFVPWHGAPRYQGGPPRPAAEFVSLK